MHHHRADTYDDLARQERDNATKAEADLAEAEAVRAKIDVRAVDRQSITTSLSRGRHSHIVPGQIRHCHTQHAALQEIARLSDGLVNATDAAPLIMAAGKTQSTERSSVISTLHKYMTDENVWEWHDHGVYRLKAYTPPEPEKSDTNGLAPTISLHHDDHIDREDELAQGPTPSTEEPSESAPPPNSNGPVFCLPQ